MNRSLLVLIAGAAIVFNAGCATKKYVRNEAARWTSETRLSDFDARRQSVD